MGNKVKGVSRLWPGYDACAEIEKVSAMLLTVQTALENENADQAVNKAASWTLSAAQDILREVSRDLVGTFPAGKPKEAGK